MKMLDHAYVWTIDSPDCCIKGQSVSYSVFGKKWTHNQKYPKSAVAGDRTRVTRVTGGNTYHYTTTTWMTLKLKYAIHSLIRDNSKIWTNFRPDWRFGAEMGNENGIAVSGENINRIEPSHSAVRLFRSRPKLSISSRPFWFFLNPSFYLSWSNQRSGSWESKLLFCKVYVIARAKQRERYVTSTAALQQTVPSC